MDKTVLLGTTDNAKIPSFGYRLQKAFLNHGWKAEAFNYRHMQMHRAGPTRNILNSMFLKRALDLNPDMVFVNKGESINNGIIQKISDAGIKTVNWSQDDPFGEFSSFNDIKNRNEYDAFFVFDPYYSRKLIETGQPNSFYLPCAVDPDLHREKIPFDERKYICDVSFLGSHDKKREHVMENLSDYDMKIWGYRWKGVSKKLKIYNKIDSYVMKFDRSMTDLKNSCRMLNLTKVNINIHAPHSRESVNLRAFEIPATKSFMLCDYYKDIPNLFKMGKEIVCYNDIKELRELIDYYKENEEERNRIAEAGWKRVVKDHTFTERIGEVLRKCDF